MGKLDICVLRLRQGRIQEFSYVGQNFLVLKWKGVLISKYDIEIEHIKHKELFRRVRVSGFFNVHQRSNLSQQIILLSPGVLEQYNSTYIQHYLRNRKRVASVYGVIMHAGNVRRIREKRVKHEA